MFPNTLDVLTPYEVSLLNPNMHSTVINKVKVQFLSKLYFVVYNMLVRKVVSRLGFFKYSAINLKLSDFRYLFSYH